MYTIATSAIWNVGFHLPAVSLDLSSEAGEMKYLSQYPTKYASEYLNHREKVILVAVRSETINFILAADTFHGINSIYLVGP